MYKISNVHTVNGHKYRDICEIIEEHDIEVPISREVLTENCGWVYDSCNPSFSCEQCNPNCIGAKKWEEFYKKESLL